MPDPSTDRIIILAQSGVTVRQAEATLGRQMLPSERLAWDRAQVKRQLEKAAKKARGPKSGADREAAFKARRSEIGEIPPPVDAERRERCRLDLLSFGLEYFIGDGFGKLLLRPPSEHMLPYIEALQESYLSDRMVHVRFPRGKGKTTWLKIGELWAASYGHRKYLFLGAANAQNAESILEDIWAAMEENKEYGDDFPEVALPIRHLEGRMQRCAVQMCGGKLTKIRRGKDRIIFPRIEGYPCSGAMLVARGREAGIRGLVRGSQRPDHAAIDDPQTRGTAKSDASCSDIAKWISGDVLALAGHDRAMSACMTTTPIYAGDISDQFGDKDLHPEWTTISVPMVISWPTSETLWDEYLELRRRDEASGELGFPNATAFYSAHREEMDDGAIVIDPGDGDPNTEISAVQHAYNLLFKHGRDAFEAEFQLAPKRGSGAFVLTSQMVAANLSGVPTLTLPAGFHGAVAAIDCMARECLRWNIIAFGPQRQSSVISYGRYPERGTLYPKNALVPEQNRAFSSALSHIVNTLFSAPITSADGKRVSLSGCGIDRGWKPRIVEYVCSRSRYKSQLYPMLGFGGGKFAPTKANGQKKQNVIAVGDHLYMAQGTGFRFIGMHSDYWQEYAQRSFLAPAMTAGATSLYGKDPLAHIDYAAEITAEMLSDKGIGSNGTEFWRWSKKPGAENHFLDTLKMAIALGSWLRMHDAASILAGDLKASRKASRRPRVLLKR
jgi:hypothetical protein